MLKRIEAIQDGKKAEEIVELNLDNCESDGAIEGINDEFSALQKLSLSNARLTSLKGFPKLLKLQELELSSNLIDGGLSSLSGCVSLQCLNLAGNKIKDLESVSPLSDLKNLTSLNLSNCPVSELADYRERIFKLIPSLKVLNGLGEDVEEVEQNGNGACAQKEDDVPHVQVTNEDDDDDDDEVSGESSVGESGEEEVGLSYLERDDISDDEEDGDYEEESEGEDEEIDDEDDEEARGVKRKLEEDAEEDES